MSIPLKLHLKYHRIKRTVVDSLVLFWLQKSRKYTTDFLFSPHPQIVGNGFCCGKFFASFSIKIQRKPSTKNVFSIVRFVIAKCCHLGYCKIKKEKCSLIVMLIFIHVHENLDLSQMPQIILCGHLHWSIAKHNEAVVMGDFGVYRNQMYN